MIYLDIDGVLRDLETSIRNVLEKYEPEILEEWVADKGPQEHILPDSLFFKYILGKYPEETFIQAPVIPGAVEFIERLKNKWAVVLNTVQFYAAAGPTMEWVNNNLPEVDYTIMGHQIGGKPVFDCIGKSVFVDDSIYALPLHSFNILVGGTGHEDNWKNVDRDFNTIYKIIENYMEE